MSKNTNKGKEKSLQEKVKNFFGIKGPSPVNFEKLKTELYALSNENLKDISPENPLNHRLKTLKELYQVVRVKRLEENAVEALCKMTTDMLSLQYSTETRHIVLQFYCCVIQGQLEKLSIMRSYFFELIRNHKIVDDISPRLDLLKALSQNGKSITYFEGDIGPFLLELFPEVITAGKAQELMMLLINIINRHAAYLDDDVVAGLIQYTCKLCRSTNCEEELQACLEIMNAVLCYSHLPSVVLQHFIFALCMTVNIEKFSKMSWKLMRDLLGTSMGHTSILALCSFLQNKTYFKMPKLLRGAVFFIGMALWGSNKVPSLMHPPTAVLPSLLRALDCEDNTVAYEIVLAVQRLIKKNGDQLQILTWDVILDIVERVLKYPDLQDANQPVPVLATSLHELITTIEGSSIEDSIYNDRLFKIIDSCSDSRDDNSAMRLIMHQAKKINPMRKDFISSLNNLLEKYFRNEVRQPVQLKVLHVLSCACCAGGYLFEDDLIDKTILQYLSHLDAVHNVVIRKAAVELLIEIAENCITKRFFEILDIIEKVLKRPFDKHAENKENLTDVEAAVLGLIRIFKKKLHVLPSSHCVQIYNILVAYIKIHYQHPEYLEEGTAIRKMIIEFLLKLRTNARQQVGILENDKEEYSLYVFCTSRDSKEATSGAPTSPPPGSPPAVLSSSTMSYVCFTDAYQVLITCIKQEKDWRVLELTLKELPKLLQNKALIISGQCSMNLLCSSLCSLVNDRTTSFLDSLKNTPTRFTRTDLHSRVFPVIASLASYHSELETYMQRMLINGLQSGLVSRSAKVCIEGLTLCTLEMRNMMFKLLPSVLLKLSQISATVGFAVSVLEFLSNLIRLPELYFSFVEDQYMSIFAIALPYTNPFKFNQYTVALAHHVIAMWFLKCRIPFRKEFAKFITKGLRSNLSVPFEEVQAADNTPTDSGVGEFDANQSQQSTNKAIIALHNELMEIGIDLMARFTFGMSSNVPKRSAISEFLLNEGQRCSWLVGNKIVTITTSGCGTKAFKYGLCEKCYASCREVSKSIESEEEVVFPIKSEQSQFQHERRRHRSAIQRSDTTLSQELTSRSHTKDDILIHRHSLASNEHSSFPANPSLTASTEESSDDKLKKDKRQLCSCWCSSWAEIHIRRPTGNTSWMMKIQNRLFLPSSPPDFPLAAITSLLLPHDEQLPKELRVNPTEHNVQQMPLEENDNEEVDSSLASFAEKEATASYSSSEALACPKSHSPIRRTNSSPDMNSGWANFENLESNLQMHFPQQVSTGEFVDPNLPSSTLVAGSERESIASHSRTLHGFDHTIPDLSCSSDSAPSEELESSSERIKDRFKVSGAKPLLKLELSLDSSTSVGSTSSSQSAGLYSRDRGPLSAGVGQTKADFTSSMNSMRDRIHTISVMSPIHNRPFESSQQRPAKDMHRSGMSPSFIFLQLYHNSFYGPSAQKPLFLHQTEVVTRALGVLDSIPPYDTHKIGVVYVGPGQVDSEFEILNNLYGSLRYVDFLRGLGTLVRLSKVDLQSTYVGGLDTNGDDGKFALIWHDDVMQVAFHVATLMPNKKTDPSRNCKKMHIANDFVNIVYNESGEDYNVSTITSQVTLASVIIRPEDFHSNVVTVKAKTEEIMEVFGHHDAYIVSDDSLPIFVRQLALHANLACLIISHQRSGRYPQVSNWLERLRKLKLLRTKVLEERSLNDDSLGAEFQPNSNIFVDDFIDYV